MEGRARERVDVGADQRVRLFGASAEGWTRWSAPTRLALILLVLALLPLLTHPGRVGVKSVLLLPEVFSGIPVRPLVWLTPPPRREGFSFEYSVGSVEGDLYAPSPLLPGAGGRHGALILILGARPLDRDAPILVRFAEGLSRAGAVVMIPASSNLAEGKIPPEEVDAIVKEVELLRAREDVDPDRIGIVGFSVGGSLAVLAATDPRLADRLAFVNAFGSYADARDLLRAVATRRLSYAGQEEPWQPHPLTIWVIARQIVDTMPEGPDREILDRLFLQEDPAARDEIGQLSPTGQAVLRLLGGPPPIVELAPADEADPVAPIAAATPTDQIPPTPGLTPAEAEEAMALLPAAGQERLRQISPVLALDRVQAHLFIMHDHADTLVPYTESRRLVERARPGTVELFTEFELFTHVVPDRPVSAPVLAAELAKLYRQMYRQLLYVL